MAKASKSLKRKKRVLTEAQKIAAIKRLEVAREAKGPSKNLSVHESVRELPEDYPLSLKSVQGWIKANKEALSTMSRNKNSSDVKERMQYQQIELYLTGLRSYLATGIWSDLFYGERMENMVKFRCVAKAYREDGTVARSIGVFYDDVGVWTEEMQDEENRQRGV